MELSYCCLELEPTFLSTLASVKNIGQFGNGGPLLLMDSHLSCNSKKRMGGFPRDLIDAATLDGLRLDRMSVNGRPCPVRQSESIL